MFDGAGCRAARALAELTREALADLSGVSAETIQAFERKLATPDARAIAHLRKALEEAGIIFIPENGGGRGVRLKFSVADARRIATLEGEGGAVGMDDVP